MAQYRITGKETVPASTVLNGTVSTDSVKSTTLLYTGSSDIAGIFGLVPSGVTTDGQDYIAKDNVYIFVPSVNGLSKVNSISQLNNGSWAIGCDTAISCAGATAYYVVGNLTSYVLTNATTANGGATATVNGVNLFQGETYSQPQINSANLGNNLYVPVVYVNGTGTSVLVVTNP